MRNGVAKSTREAYSRAWRSFTQFLSNLDEHNLCWEEKLVMFFTHLSELGRAASTIRTYMAGVRAHLKMENVMLNENHYLLKLMYKGTAKADVARLRLPITKDMLPPLLRRVPLVVKGEFEINLFQAIFATAYQGAFRIGELAGSEHAVKAKNLISSLSSDKVRIILHSSKTSKPGNLPEVVAFEPQPDNEFCPCKLLNSFSRRRYNASPFWRDQPNKFFVHANAKAVTEDECLHILRSTLALMHGVENKEYGTHSFRSGRASDLFREGKTEEDIKLQGRWKSASVR